MSIENERVSSFGVNLKIFMVVSAFLAYAAFSSLRPDRLDIFQFWVFSAISFFMPAWLLLPFGGLKKSLARSVASAALVFLSVAVLFGCFFIYKLGFVSGARLRSSSILENVPDFMLLCLSASFFCWAWLSIFIASLMVMVVSKSYKRP